jgi:heptosyltransferase III
MDNAKALSPAPNKILLIVLRYLGDVLLTTPLIHSLRQAYPDAQLDVLAYRNTAAMLEGNPDIDNVITTPNRPKLADYRELLPQLFRRYDLALAIQTGDRPFLYALLAAPFRVAVVARKPATGWWKRFFLQRWTEFDNDNTHTVLQNLRLLDLIGIPSRYSLIPPQANNSQPLPGSFRFRMDTKPYAVLHMHPQWAYKRWTIEGWLAIGHYLNNLGLKLVLSGSPEQEEKAYIAAIENKLPEGTINLAGQVSIAELAHIIAQAKLFIGPDTGITHLAAATGIPVIALYGPTNPVKWAPWPSAYHQNNNPFGKVGTQRVNNVFLVQGEGACVPCHQEGCDRHRLSHSDCLDSLSARKVQAIALSILQSENPA